jgi:hypothetical protein
VGAKRKLPAAQEKAMEAALQKLGEPSWAAFSAKLLAQATERTAAAGGGAAAGGRGRGGRGRKGGRGRGAAASQQQQGQQEGELAVQDVLNKNSRVYSEAFAAAYHEAKARLDK